jgi:hypothetical protein
MLRCLGSAARDARRESKKRTLDVAVIVDRDTATVARFERGESWPRNFDEFLDGYAKAIGVNVSALWIAALDNYLTKIKNEVGEAVENSQE